jgi:hypothetical protein
MGRDIPKEHKIYQMAIDFTQRLYIKYTEPPLDVSIFFILGPSEL